MIGQWAAGRADQMALEAVRIDVAQDLKDVGFDASDGGLVIACVPPAWLRPPGDGHRLLRWVLLLTTAERVKVSKGVTVHRRVCSQGNPAEFVRPPKTSLIVSVIASWNTGSSRFKRASTVLDMPNMSLLMLSNRLNPIVTVRK